MTFDVPVVNASALVDDGTALTNSMGGSGLASRLCIDSAHTSTDAALHTASLHSRLAPLY
jgi:hypothetical protein